MLLALRVVASVATAICPDLLAWSVLEVLLPVALIPSSVHVYVDTIAVSLIVEPLSFKHIAIDVPKLASAACLIEPPEALVSGAIWPDLDAKSMLHVAQPLAFVHGAILEDNVAPLFNHLTGQAVRVEWQ